MEAELINVLCYKLPGDVSRAVYNEYNSRWDEVNHILEYSQNHFQLLEPYQSTVKSLLAMSTFYRRVLSGMNGACDFYKTVNKGVEKAEQHTISIGSYNLDKSEYNKLLAVQITFNELLERFGIGRYFFEYTETEEFLAKCKDLYVSYTKPIKDGPDSTNDDNFPF